MEMTIRFPGGKQVDAAFDGFTVHTDQPVKAGGEGSAPTPFGLPTRSTKSTGCEPSVLVEGDAFFGFVRRGAIAPWLR